MAPCWQKLHERDLPQVMQMDWSPRKVVDRHIRWVCLHSFSMRTTRRTCVQVEQDWIGKKAMKKSALINSKKEINA